MSRVGKLPISIPSGVEVKIDDLLITVKGPKGELRQEFVGNLKMAMTDNSLVVEPQDKKKETRSMWGTARSIVQNMVKGVSEGFAEELEVNGVGYRAVVQGKYLNLSLGKSHDTKIEIPEAVTVAAKQNAINLQSYDKQKLGQFIALIIKQRPPEPYKGKGIKKKGQYVERKEGKKG